MVKQDNFSLYCSDEQKKCRSLLIEKGYFDSVPESRREYQIEDCYRILMTVALKTSDGQISKKMVSNLIRLPYPESRFAQITEESKTEFEALLSVGQWMIENAIYFVLSHEYPQKSHQLFEWAAENCTLPDDYVRGRINIEYHNEVAVPHLWHGYALVGLERYEEALKYIVQVEPLFINYKKTGGEIYQRIEFNLPKALVPLCQFKLNPTRQNLIAAQKGIEEYIKSLREPRFKLLGYLYYFHLKDQFADVYTANPKDYPEELPVPAKEKMKEIPASESAEPQTVCIWDVVSIMVGDEIGTDVELKDYVLDVTRRGEFPVLSTLYDLYLQWDEFDAAELAEETRRLLAMNDLDPEIRKKTEIFKDIAEYSAEKGSGRLVLKPENPE